jgi:hypothetical protein
MARLQIAQLLLILKWSLPSPFKTFADICHMARLKIVVAGRRLAVRFLSKPLAGIAHMV